jgi:hypothetical protein
MVVAALPDDLVSLVLQFPDPGLDWTQCRLVSKTWHLYILALDKKPGLWMGPLRLDNPVGWNDRLLTDLANVQPTPAPERERLIQLQIEEYGEDFPKWYHAFRRIDETIDYGGTCYMNDWETREPIVRAKISLLVRGARELIETSEGKWKSEPFSFAGVWWFVSVGVDERYWMGGSGGRRFGIEVIRCPQTRRIKDKSRSDLAKFSLKENIPCLIRYQASYTAGAATFKAGDFYQNGPEENRLKKSCFSGESDCSSAYTCDYFPLPVAAFALGPPPACPDLRISIELEHLGYAYDIP